MPARKFMVAPIAARLIRRDYGFSRVVEGYLLGGTGRSSHVSIQDDAGHLVLTEEIDGGTSVDVTAVPRRQAEALLEICVGRLEIDRTAFTMGGREALLERVLSSDRKPINFITILFDDEGSARSLIAPPWLGTEVTDEPSYANRPIALSGVPERSEPSVSNSALEALLDMLETRIFEENLEVNQGPDPESSLHHLAPSESMGVTAAEPAREQAEARVAAATSSGPFVLRNEGMMRGLSRLLVEHEPDSSETSTAIDLDQWSGRRKR